MELKPKNSGEWIFNFSAQTVNEIRKILLKERYGWKNIWLKHTLYEENLRYQRKDKIQDTQTTGVRLWVQQKNFLSNYEYF